MPKSAAQKAQPRPGSPKIGPPRIGFVSLGCPKALVDSERIITELRAEGYELAASYEDADPWSSIPAASRRADRRVARRDRRGSRRERARRRDRLPWRASRADPRPAPRVLEITGPHATREVLAAVNTHLPQPHDPFLDLLPPQGIRLTPRHYAYLKISEGCNNKCSFCIIPLAARQAREPAAGRGAARGGNAGARRRARAARHLAGYERLRHRPALSRRHLARRGSPRVSRAGGELSASSAPGCGCTTSIRTRTSMRSYHSWPRARCCLISTFRSSTRARRYSSACGGRRSRGHARAHPAWRRDCRDLTVRRTFIVGFPGETDADFSYCSIGSMRHSSTASAVSSMRMLTALRPTLSPASCRRR